MALTLSAPAPTGAGLSAFLDAYLKGRTLNREAESDELRRTLAAMQLLQAGQQYQAGERTAAEQALLPEAIRSALTVPQQTMTLPPTAVPGSETLAPDVSEYYTGRGTPTMLPGETMPVGRTLADVSAALKPEQLVALLRQAPKSLDVMGLQSEEQIRRNERREQGRQKFQVLEAQRVDLYKSRRWIDELDKSIEMYGVLLGAADTPDQTAAILDRRERAMAKRKLYEDEEIEKTVGQQEQTRIAEARDQAVQAKRAGGDIAAAMNALYLAIGEAKTKTGREAGQQITGQMAVKQIADLVADPTERDFHRAVWADVQQRQLKGEAWSPALWAKSARTLMQANPQQYGEMGFKILEHKTLPDWYKEAFFTGTETVPGLTGIKDAGILLGKALEEDEAKREGRKPTLQGAAAKAQAYAQGKRDTDPVAMAQLRMTAQGLLDAANQRVREAERAVTEGSKGLYGERQKDFMRTAGAEVTTAKEVAAMRARTLEAVEKMALAGLPPALQKMFQEGTMPPPIPVPPPRREPLSRKDPRYQGARNPQPSGLGLTDAEIEQRYGVQITD